MEQVISKSALNNILTAAGPAVVDMDEDTQKALAALWELLGEAQGENLILANLSDCEEYVIWKGADDVRFLVESGCYQDELLNMTPEEEEKLYKEVANRLDWSDVASASIAAGNKLIEDELAAVLAEE
jgi:hypothetical protein